MARLTYNTRLIFGCGADKLAIVELLESHRQACNECSVVKFKLGYSDNSIVPLHRAFYGKFREKSSFIPSQIVIRAEREILSAYSSAKSNKHKLKSPVIKKSLSMRLDKRCHTYKKGVFGLISLKGRSRIKCRPFLYPKLQGLLERYKFCDPLIFEKKGEIWIAMTFEIPELLAANKLALGVDLGCVNVAATSEGKLFRDKNYSKRRRKLRFLKRSLQSKSKKSKSAFRKLRRLRNKERNASKNFTHNLANKILETQADTIVLENLSKLKKKQNKFQNKNRISQVPFYELRLILTYKALLHNKQVITVSPAYTSQIDHRTGRKDGQRIGGRYIGQDGRILHADINAACNIAIKSNLPCSIRASNYAWQATVISPIACKSLFQEKS